MTLEDALDTVKDLMDKPMTDMQAYKYRCAQSKIIKAIISNEYKLVKVDEVRE